MASRCLAFCLALLLLPGACLRYQPLPLTPAGIDTALARPDLRELAVKAKELRHPILSPVSVDLRDGFSPDEAAILAVLVNPSLRAERDKRQIAEAQLLEAGLLPNPELGLSLHVPTGGPTQGTGIAYGIDLTWSLRELITRPARKKAAAAGLGQVDLDVAWREWQVAEQAKSAVYAVASLDAQTSLAAQSSRLLAENLELIRQAVRSGMKTELEQASAEAASRQAEQKLLSLREQGKVQQLALSQLLGFPPETTVSLQRGLVLPSSFRPPPAGQLFAGIEARRLDLVALRRGYESQEAALQAAILGQFPQIRLGPSHERDTDKVAATPQSADHLPGVAAQPGGTGPGAG